MLKLAWLNLWRNPRRTCITALSVCFALFFCVFLNSVYIGIWNAGLDNMLRMQGGHIEIQPKSGDGESFADNFMEMEEDVLRRLACVPGVTDVLPRVETFALASSGNFTRGVQVLGIFPDAEKSRQDFTSLLVEGNYLDAEQDNGILLGEGLSRLLGVHVGDSVAMMGKGYHGVSAVGLYPVRGILAIPVAKIDKVALYMHIAEAQEFIGLPHGYSRVYLLTDPDRPLPTIRREVTAALSSDLYEVQSWKEVMAELLTYSETTRAIGLMVNLILYLLVGSGIVGTIIMLVNERRYEFAMMIALGMQRGRLALTLCCELLLIMLMGAALGVAVALPLIYYFSEHTLLLSAESVRFVAQYNTNAEFNCYIGTDLFVEQFVVVLLMSAVVMLYPVFVLFRLKVDRALKQ